MNKEELTKLVKESLVQIAKIALIAIIIIVLIAGCVYIIQIENGSYKEDDWSNTGYAVKQMALSDEKTKNIISSEDGWKIDIDLDTTVDDIINTLEENGGVLDDYISKSNQKEYLTAFIKAELITQYPDLRNATKIGTATEENEFQGCIQIHRALPDSMDGATEILTYVDYDTFNSYVDSGNSVATKHFTLDESGDLIVAGWTRTTTNITSNVPDVENVSNKVEYTLLTRSVNYKTAVESCAMPFDFLWALTVMGDDGGEFAYNVAQLALESKIILTVQDNLTIDITNHIEEYDIQEKIIKQAVFKVLIDEGNQSKTYRDQTESTQHYKTETNIKTETCSVSVNITYADTWIIKYENTFSNSIQDTIKIGPDTEPIEDTTYEFVENGEITQSIRDEIYGELDKFIFEICGGEDAYNTKIENGEIILGNVTDLKCEKYERTINKSTTYESTVTSNRYVEGTPTVTEKTDKDSEEENFVTLFVKSRTAKSNILSAPDWLFEILENSEKTADMVDLVKYLLYKATGKDYGVTEYDFSEYLNTDFSSIRAGSNIFLDYLHSWENCSVWLYQKGKSGYSDYVGKYITEDKTQYICYTDNGSTKNFGFGVCHYYGGRYNHQDKYQELGVDITQYDLGSTLDVEIVDKVKQMYLNDTRKTIEKKLNEAGITLEEYQIQALWAIAYQWYTDSIDDFIIAYKQYGNTEELRQNFTHSGDKPFLTGDGGSSWEIKRANANWTLFSEGRYLAGDDTELNPDDYAASGFLAVAESIWYEVCTSGKFTRYGGASIPCTGPSIDCSAYVSWVLYEYGYTEFKGGQTSSSVFYSTNWNKKYGWEEISIGSRQNPYDSLQPGDLFVRYESGGTHHILIVVEIKDGKIYGYDCGNSKNWLQRSQNGEPIDRSYFLTESGPGKIIRVTEPY